MRTFCTILLILVLSTPGVALADPAERSNASFWQDLFGWVAESLSVVFDGAESSGGPDALPGFGGAIDPLGSAGAVSGGADPAGASGDEDEDEPPLPNMGGSLDPFG